MGVGGWRCGVGQRRRDAWWNGCSSVGSVEQIDGRVGGGVWMGLLGLHHLSSRYGVLG